MAITLVQHTKTNTGFGTSISQAFASNNTAGNAIIVGIKWSVTSGSTTLTCSDSRNTYHSACVVQDNGTTAGCYQIFYAFNIGAGANTVTINSTQSDNNYSNLFITEWSGLGTTSAMFVAGNATYLHAGTSSNPSVTVSGTASGQLCYCISGAATATETHGTGFTSIDLGLTGEQTEYMLISGSSVTATSSGADTDWCIAAAAFAPPSASPAVNGLWFAPNF